MSAGSRDGSHSAHSRRSRSRSRSVNLLSSGNRAGTWTVTNPYIQDSLWLNGLAQVDSGTAVGQFIVTGGSVTYRDSRSTYTVPVLDGRIVSGGSQYNLNFRMATPEFTNPFGYAEVNLAILGNGGLQGGATLWQDVGQFREGRAWSLGAPSP